MKALLKYGLTTIVFMAYSCISMAQNKEFVINALADKYNTGKYTDIYGMLTDDFKKQAREEQITGFFSNNLKAQLGNIISWKADGADNANYVVRFENGKLLLKLYVDKDNNISGMQWLPYKEKIVAIEKSTRASMTDNPMKTELQLYVDSEVVAYLNDTVNSGLSIGVISGKKIESYHYGEVEKGSGKLATNETIYEIGSLTKTFTGILLAHAVNEGKMKLDDDIRKYLNGSYTKLEYAGKPILIKHLANHTSGLPRIPDNLEVQQSYDENDPYRNYNKAMILEYLKNLTVATEPGGKMEYSNLGVGLLGVILENAYKKSLQELVNLYINRPAGMKNTYFAKAGDKNFNVAKGYREKDGQLTPYWHLGDMKAAGGLRSNLVDMISFLKANMDDINKDFSLSHTPVPSKNDGNVGFCWMLAKAPQQRTLVWHNGATFGFTSFCGYIPEKKIGIVVLSNSGNSVDEVAMQLLKQLSEK